MSDSDAVEEVLAERPDLEAPLAAVLAVDDEHETWTFDDLPIESGPFGELVGRGVVEAVGEEYRLADHDAVRAALAGEAAEDDAASTAPTAPSIPSLPSIEFPRVDRVTALAVAGAIALVGLFRAYPVGAVYRNGDVVLSGNDPYAYRYRVERVVDGASTGWEMPENVLHGEPLYVATMAWLSDLLGGAEAVGHVLAWYPVVSALLAGAIVYAIAVRVTEDRRVGVAAVLFLAVLPGHAVRTSLGFADHHAFDYLWLGATALAVTWLAGVDRDALTDGRTWAVVIGMGVAVAGQVLSWEAGPLLLAPVGLVVAGRAAIDVRRGHSPLPAGALLVAGLVVGTALAFVGHAITGYQLAVVVLVPGVIAAGSAGAVGLAFLFHRMEWGVRRLLAGYAVAVVVGVLVLSVALAPLWSLFTEQLDRLFRGGTIAETQSLFSLDAFPSLVLFLFGFALLLAIPAMVVGLRRSIEDGRWLALSAYAWYFLALSALQIRFVGELGTFAAVFAGIGFVWTAAWIDAIPSTDGVPDGLAPLRLPRRRVLGTLLALLVLFGGFGALQVGVKTSQVLIEDDAYDSATYIEEHADERGLAYPENYVLSDWGVNRMYNYVVNGESEHYTYAREYYEDFATGTDPDSWYDDFEGRVGYVVLLRATPDSDRESTLWRLTRAHGSADGDVAGVGHYRTVYVPDGGSRTVVAVVAGATVTGVAPANATVTASTDVSVPGGEFTYERRATAGSDGRYALRVAYPGTYDVTVGNATTTVSVPESAVRQGETVTVG